VINMGPVWVLTFSDPDQGSHEVVWENPQVTMADSRMRADWTVVEIE
jgi:hypothetical protein